MGTLIMTQPKKNKLWIILILVLVALILLARPILRGIGDGLIVNDPPEKVDLITSVNGPDYRAAYAAELCHKHLAPRLFFTGGYNEFDSRYDAEWNKYLATTYGVPAGDIAIDTSTVISTYDEAERLKAYIDAHSKYEIKTVLVVTDPYQTRRAQWAYQYVLGDEVTVMVTAVPFDRTGYTSSWWRYSVSREMVFDEYFKSIFYLFRYQWTSGALQDWLSQFDQF
jgi:uncharacterized SAM-binding protein YcdF (DUF218 family)